MHPNSYISLQTYNFKHLQTLNEQTMKESHSDLYIGNPFRLTPDGFIQCYSTNRKILDPWIMWSETSGHDEIDIEALYNTWINGGLNEPWLPAPPTK